MAARHDSPNQQNACVATAAFLAMAALFSAPALAATTNAIPCSDATLDVPLSVLVVNVVNHEMTLAPDADDQRVSSDAIEIVASVRVLLPRAEAAVRNAFKDSAHAVRISADSEWTSAVQLPPMAGADSTSASSPVKDDQSGPITPLNTRLPGISDEVLSRYKQQMYRRDI